VEFSITVTVAEHGTNATNGHRFLDGFTRAHPEVGAAVSQNLETGHMTVTFIVEAEDLLKGVSLGKKVFIEGATESGLGGSEILDASIHVVADDEDEPACQVIYPRELQPVC